MKPLELSCITGVWKSALGILEDNLPEVAGDLQLWFPWGNVWRGHDRQGSLPPTDFPPELAADSFSRFGGRFWKTIDISSTRWLISLRAPVSARENIETWEMSEKAGESLKMLSDFVVLECLLGLTMRILETQSHEHTGHWDRVRSLSVAIGSEMGLPIRELVELELAAMLHDIGKIGLPEDILQSAGPLNDEDRKKMESHCLVGSGMIREIPGLEMVSEIVLCHHEAIDGSGYPRGIKDQQIPLGAKIIAVADSFDAMTHYRPYAMERTYLETYQELKGSKGKFSSEVVAALEKVLRRLGIIDTKPLVGTSEDW